MRRPVGRLRPVNFSRYRSSQARRTRSATSAACRKPASAAAARRSGLSGLRPIAVRAASLGLKIALMILYWAAQVMIAATAERVSRE